MFILNKKNGVITECNNEDVINHCKKHSDEYAVGKKPEELKGDAVPVPDEEPEEMEFVLTVLERLAKRYADRKGLWGIEILNEPVSQEMWDGMGVSQRYKPVEPLKAAGSKGYDMDQLRSFYIEAYDRMRKYLPVDKKVVFHDGFNLTAWKNFMREEKYQGVVLDTHQYLMMAEMFGCGQSVYLLRQRCLRHSLIRARLFDQFPQLLGHSHFPLSRRSITIQVPLTLVSLQYLRRPVHDAGRSVRL